MHCPSGGILSLSSPSNEYNTRTAARRRGRTVLERPAAYQPDGISTRDSTLKRREKCDGRRSQTEINVTRCLGTVQHLTMVAVLPRITITCVPRSNNHQQDRHARGQDKNKASLTIIAKQNTYARAVLLIEHDLLFVTQGCSAAHIIICNY